MIIPIAVCVMPSPNRRSGDSDSVAELMMANPSIMINVPRMIRAVLEAIYKYLFLKVNNLFMPDTVMNSSLVMRPSYERATEYLYHWSIPYIRKSQQLGTSVTDLAGDDANRAKFVQSVQASKLLVLQGHGSKTTLTGQHYEPILEMKDEGTLLEGRVIYTLSCLTGAELAPYEVANNGVVSYLSYTQEFAFFTTTGAEPLNDTAAMAFFNAAHSFWGAMLEGKTTGEALIISQAEFDKWIADWQASDDPSAPFIAAALVWDRDCQQLYGSHEATVSVPIVTAAVSSFPIFAIAGLGAISWIWNKLRKN